MANFRCGNGKKERKHSGISSKLENLDSFCMKSMCKGRRAEKMKSSKVLPVFNWITRWPYVLVGSPTCHGGSVLPEKIMVKEVVK